MDAREGRSDIAKFTGHQLGTTGFETPVSLDMELRSECSGPWCGSISPEGEVLIFAREDGDRQVVEIGACPFWVQGAPDAETVQALVACARGEECPEGWPSF